MFIPIPNNQSLYTDKMSTGAAKLHSTTSVDHLQDIGTSVAERIQFEQDRRRRRQRAIIADRQRGFE